MDDTYILNHLKKWAELFYGENNRKYTFARKEKDSYIFGYQSKKDEKINVITKPVAIYLCVGASAFIKVEPKKETKKVKRERPTKERRIPKITTKRKPKTKRFNLFES